MISLALVVDINNVDVVRVRPFDGQGDEYEFGVGSQTFQDKKNWIVKGEYNILPRISSPIVILEVGRLEKDIEITINKPAIVSSGEGVPDPEATIENYINTPVTAVVFHRNLLISSARDTKKKFVTAYADACIDAYQKTNPSATREDFAVIEIDWSNKHVELKSVAPLVDNSVDNEKEENE